MEYKCCRKAVEQLVGERENQIVLFGGTSAGGRGSMVGFSWTRWPSFFLLAPNKGGGLLLSVLVGGTLFVKGEEPMFLHTVTIFNYNDIQLYPIVVCIIKN